MAPYKRRSQSDWLDIIQQQETSGLKVTDFCEQQALSSKTFYKYRRAIRFPPESQSPTASFIKITPPVQQATTSMNAIAVLHCANNQLHIHSNCDEKWLAKLLRALS